MRISDWSSDVCSSDLLFLAAHAQIMQIARHHVAVGVLHDQLGALADLVRILLSGLDHPHRSEEHTSELQSLMRISYAVFCLQQKPQRITHISLLLPPSPPDYLASLTLRLYTTL